MDTDKTVASASGVAEVTYVPDVIDCVSRVLESYCSSEKGDIELEVVIGERKHGRFVAGMDFADFLSVYEDLKRAMEAAPSAWELVQTKSIHFHYPHGIRRVVSPNEPVAHVQKTPLANVLLQTSRSKYVFRVNTKREIQRERLQIVSRPQLVRMIERWSFRHCTGSTYDLSKVSQGTDQEDACSRDPIFEFEMEFVKHVSPSTLSLSASAPRPSTPPPPPPPPVILSTCPTSLPNQPSVMVGRMPNQVILDSHLLLQRIVDMSGRYDLQGELFPEIHLSLL